ncbi:MAG: copper chaperone PCu(A)C [Rhizobiaceae bacterium]
MKSKTVLFAAMLAAAMAPMAAQANPIFKTAPVTGGRPDAPLLLAADETDAMAMIKVGDLEIVDPFARATLPGAPVSGGYMVIRNTGTEADRLLGGTAAFAGKVEIHEMTMDGEVMQMREIEGGLEIPAGGEVVLAPGGMHIMFMQMAGQLKEGEVRKVTLRFEKAGTVEFELPVRRVERGGHGNMDHSGHGMSD